MTLTYDIVPRLTSMVYMELQSEEFLFQYQFWQKCKSPALSSGITARVCWEKWKQTYELWYDNISPKTDIEKKSVHRQAAV